MKAGYFKHIGYFLAVGMLATITMDFTALLMLKMRAVDLGPYRVVPDLLGRWIGSFPSGNFVHSTILDTQPVPNEKVIGILSHYSIGLTLTSILLFPHVRILRRQIRLGTALLFALATCIFPWLLMFPAMGFGMAALKTPHPSSLVMLSTLNHLAFGAGIFLWSKVVPLPSRPDTRSCEVTIAQRTDLSHSGRGSL